MCVDEGCVMGFGGLLVCWFGFEGGLFLEGCLGFGGSGLYV